MIIVEGLALCFILLVVCIIGISNGPVGLVALYEKNVQDRVVELGLTTKEKIKKISTISTFLLIVPSLILLLMMVYYINGAKGFFEGFWQMAVLLLIMGLFDRTFIDWYWVGHTKAWFIPGTEDLMPYIPKKIVIKKWLGVIIGYPIIAAALAGIMMIFIK